MENFTVILVENYGETDVDPRVLPGGPRELATLGFIGSFLHRFLHLCNGNLFRLTP